jgi:hypothetical protein
MVGVDGRVVFAKILPIFAPILHHTIPYTSLFIGALLLLAACGPDTSKPPRPLDMSGTWVMTQFKFNSQHTQEAAKKLAKLEQGSEWNFDGKGKLVIRLNGRSVLEGVAADYDWQHSQRKLVLTGGIRFTYDILYHTNDSMALYNIETLITYKFKRDQFGKATVPKDSTLIPPPLDSALVPRFEGKWEMKWFHNPRMSTPVVQEVGDVLEGHQWIFGADGKFSIVLKGKTGNGTWQYYPELEKLLLRTNNKTHAYRVTSLAKEIFSIEAPKTGITMGFRRKK